MSCQVLKKNSNRRLAIVIATVVLFVLVSAVSVVYASAGWITGKFNKAYDFSGSVYVDAGSVYNGVKTAAFWVKGTAAGTVLDFNGTQYVSIVSNTVSLTGITGTIYVDGVAGSTVDSSWHYVAITTDTGINASAVKFGSNATNDLVGVMDDVKFYNYALSAREINEKYRGGGAGAPSIAQGGTIDGSLYVMSGGNVGIGTTGPDRKLDVLDATNPQLRLTHTDGSVYAELQADSSGYLILNSSGDLLDINDATISLASQATDFDIIDETGSAMTVSEGANNYLAITTTGSSENISFGNATTNPSFTFAGSGAVTITGSAEGTNALILSAGDLTLTNGDLTISSGEASITSSTTSTDVLTLASVADATADIISITADKVSGTIIDIDISGSPTLTAALIGIDLDLSTGSITPGAYDMTGLTITLPSTGTGDHTFAKFIEGSTTLYDFDAVSAQFNVPLSVNVGGDVGFDYDLVFMNTGMAQILSESGLRIAAGDANNAENLVLTTGGTGDVIVELLNVGQEFKVSQGTDNTTTSGAFRLNIDTSTDTHKGFYLDYQAIDDDAADTLYAAYFDITIDDDTTADDTVSGLYINVTNNDDDYTAPIYGLQVANLATASSTASRAIYQAGTAWQYGLYIEDQVYLAGNVGIGATGPDRLLDVLDASNPQLRLTQADGTQYAEFQADGSGDLTLTLSGDEMILPDDNLKICTGGACDAVAGLAGTGNLVVENDVFIIGSLAQGNAATATGKFTGFDSATSKTLDITSISGNNPVVRKATLYIEDDPGADASVQCRLSFYNADSMTEDELITAFYFILTYTETNGGAVATDTTDTVDDISGLVKYDLIRYLGGTAENVRLTAAPSGTTLTFTALANDHADDTGIARVAEITEIFQLYDADTTNEIHAKLEMLSDPGDACDVVIDFELQ